MSLLSEVKTWDDVPSGTFLTDDNTSYLKMSDEDHISFGKNSSIGYHATTLVSFIPREFML